ncbi:hypothetical protein HYO65_gp082 [Tenacibaculum phage PTm1]|uniref:Uncharacterized protein n=2 Tax=Shirahamavirus PTm1 TaxID=2846435 RepID=A0A5S9C110_9CAUD|nr:hypothetical protein HYO65_gp082 [Tenacibaculum phage PTm1]BBI90474.1 hypothetical protein [Tenacibaculum phage PTm1]BBI90780.1 hypothetical protein [Tenacibaculum phage PTm5]
MGLLDHVNEAFGIISDAKKPQEGDSKEYKAFFAKKLKKYGVKSPDELPADKKDDFFDEIDREWKSDAEGSNENLNEGIKMNNLDWGKTTAERNANQDKYNSLKSDAEKEAFLKKLKGMNESLNEAKSPVKVDMKAVEKEAKFYFNALEGDYNIVVSYFPDFKGKNGGYMADFFDPKDKDDNKLGYQKKNNYWNVAIFSKQGKLISKLDSVNESKRNLLSFVSESLDYNARLEAMKKRKSDIQLSEAKDWGTLEISDENDLIKLIKKIAKKSKTFLKKITNVIKDSKANKVVEELSNGYVILNRYGEVYEAVWYNNAVTILKDSVVVESLSEAVFKSNLTNENFIVSDLVNENKNSKFVIGQPLRYGGMETVVCGISESGLTLDIDGEKVNINQKEL